ncbi:MAG: T9SS type A sorting domain-containing protein [Ignavibacteria bacterium]|nr:T9SS type A sorting domain-containing protein [Ignavibacteria bacterium]
MNRFDSALSARQRGGGFVERFKAVAATLLSLLVVGSIAASAQPTLTHVGPPPPAAVFTAGQICSGQTPQFEVGTTAKPVTTYNLVEGNVALEAEVGATDIIGNLGDDQVWKLPAGDIQAAAGGNFIFEFFGQPHNLSTEGLFIGTNGFVRFQDGDPTNDANVELLETGIIAQNIPNVAGPNGAAYFLNIDLAPQAGEDVDWEIQDVNGGDALVLTFRDVSQYNPLLVYPYQQVEVQIILYPNNHPNTPNMIEVRLGNWPDPNVIPARVHTIGVENQCGTVAYADADHNADTWAVANAAGEVAGYSITFDPQAGASQTLTTTLYVVGPNGVINTYSTSSASPDDITRSGATAGTTGIPVSITSNTAVTSVTPAGQLTFFAVVEYEDCIIEVTNTVTLTVNPTPTAVTITGPVNVCVGTNYNYNVPLNNGNTYSWTSTDGFATITPAIPTINANTATVNWATGSNGGTAQTLTSTETTPAGCQAVHTVNVTVYTVPNGTISGPTPVCANSAGNVYSISGGPYGAYQWSITGAPAGTTTGSTTGTTFSVNWGDFAQPGTAQFPQVRVTVSNGPGGLCSFTATPLVVTVNPRPPVKTITASDATPCVNQTITYSVGLTAGNNYAWTAAGGTFAYTSPGAYVNGTPTLNLNSVQLQWTNAGSGRSMTVNETTPQGCLRTTTMSGIVVEALPTPVITGPSINVCGYLASAGGNPSFNTVPNPIQHTYAVAVPNASNTYAWSIPAASGYIVSAGPGTPSPTPGPGITSVSGLNVTQITVRWNNPAISVARTVNVTETSVNNCAGNAPTFNLTVVHTPEAANFSLAGPGITTTDPCANTTGVIYTGTTTLPAGTLQQVYVLAGGTLVSSVDAYPNVTATVNWGNAATGTLRHEATAPTGCVSYEEYVITIRPLPEADITGPSTVCGGTTGQVYGVTNIQNGPITHSWSFASNPGGIASFPGATTNSTVTVDFANPGAQTIVVLQDFITGPGPWLCTNTITYNITVNPTPAAPIIAGADGGGTPEYVCAGTTEGYTVTGIGGGTTTISVVGGTPSQTIFAGAGPFNFNVTWGFVPGGGAGSITATITLNNCPSTQTVFPVTVSPLPAVPIFEYSLDNVTFSTTIPPLCVYNVPFYVRVQNSTAGVTYNWNEYPQICWPTASASDNPGGGTNELWTITNWNCAHPANELYIVAYAQDDITGCISPGTGLPAPWTGLGAPYTSSPAVVVAPVPTPVISGPTDACNNVFDPAGMNGATVDADPTSYTYTYSTPQVVGNSYSWTVTNGYVVATSTDGGSTWTYLNPVATTNGAPILNANTVQVVFYGPTPGKVKVSEIAPGGCQATTLDYNVNLNPFPIAQSLVSWSPEVCSGDWGLLASFNSEATFTYRVETSTDGGSTWTPTPGVGTQTGNGGGLLWFIPPASIPYTAVPPNITTYTFRITAQHTATGCGWYPVSNTDIINVNPKPADNIPVVNTTPLTCEGDNVVVEVGDGGTPSESWVQYQLMRRQIADLSTGAPIAPTPYTYVGSPQVGNGIGSIQLIDNTAPAGGYPLLNADVYQYQVEAVTDMAPAPPPNIQCTTMLAQTVTERVFALPLAQVVSYTPNPICWEADLTVDLSGSQDGVEYEILRDGLSMAPPVIVDGNGGPVQVIVPAVQVMPSNPLFPTAVVFSTQARLRTEAFPPYDRPIPPSSCPNTFGYEEVTVNPKPVAVINGPDVACGPSTVDYTPGPWWGGWPSTYDWAILFAADPYPAPHSDPPVGTTPLFANNTGFGTVDPFTVDWGVHLLSCDGTYNPITVVLQMIETNLFNCPDTAFKEITIEPTLSDAVISGPTQACIYGGFEQHLTTYTISRPNPCIFPAGTTFLWSMPTGPVIGVIRSGQGTPTIVVEWTQTGGTNIGTIQSTVTLPPSHGGCATTVTYDVIVYPLPQPIVVGPTSVCQGDQNVIYTADYYATDNYEWIVVGGTINGGSGSGTIADPGYLSNLAANTISVNWLDQANPNAYVRLNQVSAAGCYNTNTLQVTVNPTPTPVIGGPAIVCDNSVYQYSTQSNAPNNVYQWTISGNAVINNGANQATVTIQTGAIGGGTQFVLELTETVQATTCTKTVSRTIDIVEKPNPTITRITAGGAVGGACLNQTIEYGDTDPVAGNPGYSYMWTVYNGSISGSNTASTVIVTWNTIGTGTVTLAKWHTSSQCTTTVSMDVNITAPPQPAISGPLQVCGEGEYTYSTPFVVGNTYEWTISGNGTITSGANTNAAVIKFDNPLPGSTLSADITVTESTTLSGCEASAVVEVTINYQPQVQNIDRIAPAGPVGQACLMDQITYALPNNNPGSTYQWTVTGGSIVGSSTNYDVTVQWTSAGAQVLTVVETDASGACEATSTLNVSVTYKPTPAISGPVAPCTDVDITYSTPAVPGSTYQWSITPGVGYIMLTGTTSNYITVRFTAAGPYTITLTEANGPCEVTTSVDINVTQLPTPLITRVSPPGNAQLACEGDIITYSTPEVAGNSYLWTVVGGGTILGSNTSNEVTVQWVSQGTHALTVLETTPGGGCFDEATLWVTVTYKPTPNINGANVACIEKILTYYTPAVAGDTYEWSITPANSFSPVVGYPNSNSITVQWILPGLHTVTVTETNVAGGCVTTVSMDVQVNEIPAPFITSPTGYGNPPGRRPGIVCNFSTHTYTTFPTPGNTFHFFVTGGTIIGNPYTNQVVVEWGPAGIGTIWVVETVPGSDCITTKLDSIDIRPTPAPTITGSSNPCGNSLQTYSTPFVAGNSYEWTVVGAASWFVVPGNPNQIRVTWNSPVWPNTIAGSVSVTEWVTDVLPDKSCINSTTLNVTVRPNPPVPTITDTSVVCATDLTDTPATINQVTYSSSDPGGVSFLWTISSNGTIIGSSTSSSVQVQWTNTGLTPTTGTITVRHTSIPWGCENTASMTVTINPLPRPNITGDLSACQNTIHAYSTPGLPGHSYSWTVGGGNIIRSGQGTPNVMVEWTLPGTYTLTVSETNTYRCTAQDQISVTVNELPDVTITASGPTTFCQGGDVTLTAPIGFESYVWSTGETARSIVVRTTGQYWVKVTNEFGCSNNSDTITINVFPSTLPIITVSGPTTFCEGGSVVLTAPSGFSNYLWSTGETSQSITVTQSGTYTVTIADNNGCTGTSTEVDVVVNPKPAPILTVVGSTTVCSGDSVEVRAPAGYVSYTWISTSATNYGTGRTIFVSQQDEIYVEVVDLNGCVGQSDTVSIEVSQITQPVVIPSGPTTFCEGGSVVLSAPAGFASYIWSNGATTREITVEDGGEYSVTVVNAVLCVAASSKTEVTVNPLPERPSIERRGDTLKAISPVAEAWQWYKNGTEITGANASFFIVTQAGIYRVAIKDDNTCSAISNGFDVILTGLDDDVVAGKVGDIRLYPNPTTGMFTIEADIAKSGVVSIELVNTVGEIVKTITDDSQGGAFKKSIDMGTLASGVYNVVVTSANQRWTVRLVRQ